MSDPAGFKKLSPHWSGANLNTLLWEGGGWSNQQAYEAARTLGPRLIRYPGGTITDYFDWRTGGAVDRCRFRTVANEGCRDWDTVNLPNLGPFNAFTSFTGGTLANLKTLLNGAGAQPLFTLNLITASYQDNLEMLESAEAMGLAVDYVQLGNEHWFADENYEAMFTDGASYGALAKDWITKLKVRFPEAKFVVTGHIPEFDPDTGEYTRADNADHIERVTVWNQQMVSSGVLDVADAVSLHFYNRPVGDLMANGFEPAVVNQVLGHAADYFEQYFQRPEYLALPEDTRIWFTEYNINGSLAPGIVRSWVHGLYIGLATAELLAHSDVEILVTHMLMGSGIWQSIFHPGGFTGDVQAVPNSTPYSLTATGNVLQKFYQRNPSLSFIKAVAATDVGADNVDSRLVKGVLFSDQTQTEQALLFINGSSESLVINPDILGQFWSVATIVHAPAGEQILGPGNLTTESMSPDEPMLVPAYSVTIVE